MNTRLTHRILGACLLVLLLAGKSWAQTAVLEGSVKVKLENRSVVPIEGAVVDIYRRDVPRRFQTKTDKSGAFKHIGLASGVYLIVASGPGIQATWYDNVRLTESARYDFAPRSGDSTRPKLDDVLAAIAEGKEALGARLTDAEAAKLRTPAKPQPTPEELLYQRIYDAMRTADTAVVKRLIEEKPELIKAQVGPRGATLLDLSVVFNLKPVVEMLLAQGVDPNVKSRGGLTALASIYVPEGKEVAELLLQKGADVNVSDEEGHTALHYAAMDGNFEKVRFLLEHKANAAVKTRTGKTPLDFAREARERRRGVLIDDLIALLEAAEKR
jgi:uncharacterized protein